MTIRVTCPNGHKLAAKSSRAGTIGTCPACGAKFKIPEPEKPSMTESSILQILGIGQVLRENSVDLSDETKREGETSHSALRTERTTQICPQCDWEIDAGYHICPHCRYYLINKTAK